MSVFGALAGLGGGLLGNALGGHQNSPLHTFQRQFAPFLYGQGGVGDSLWNQKHKWAQFYNKMIGLQKGLGKSEIRNVRMNQREANANTSQDLIGRGLYNTTVLDSQKRDNRDYAQRNIQDIRQGLLGQKMGLLMGKQQKSQEFSDKWRNLQMMLYTGPGGSMSNNQAPQQDNSGLSYLLSQLIGGGIGGLGSVFSGGQPTVTNSGGGGGGFSGPI